MSVEIKRRFRSGLGGLATGFMSLHYWWPYILTEDEPSLQSLTIPFRRDEYSFFRFAFEHSVKRSNKSAAEFFYQKLSAIEKETALMSAIRILLSRGALDRTYHDGFLPIETISIMFRYLLSLMSPDQQIIIFREQPSKALKYFFVWPLQDEFSDVAERVWCYLPQIQYGYILKELYKGRIYKTDHYFQKTLEEVFLHLASDSKKILVKEECKEGTYFDKVLKMRDVKALARTFRACDSTTSCFTYLSETKVGGYCKPNGATVKGMSVFPQNVFEFPRGVTNRHGNVYFRQVEMD